MRVKQYNVFKTWKKTASENNLEIVKDNNNILLFDFDLLENINISDMEKNHIKKECTQAIKAYNKFAYVGSWIEENFSSFSALCDFNLHNVYNGATGKMLYKILELKKIEYSKQNRNSIYEKFDIVEKFILDSGKIEPIVDIEL